MIQFVLGGFGSGKSYAGMRMIRGELLNGYRGIVTNLAVKEKDFAAYLHTEFPKSPVCLHQRLRLLDDEQVPQFFLHRISTNALWYEVPAPDAEAEKKGARPDWTRWRDKGILFIIEEAHEFFNARYWQEIGRCFGAYKNQNRKFGDDIIFITPQISEIDKQLRSSGQTYTVLSNLGQRKIKGIRMPPLFLAREYTQIPTPQSHPANTYTYGLDLKLANCYDTAKGVRGVQGLLADKERKTAGLPWWIVPIGAVAVLLLLLFGVKLFKGTLTRGFTQSVKHVEPARTIAPVNAGPAVRPAAVPVVEPGERPERSGERVVCTGYLLLGKKPLVFLSDGRTAEGPEVQMVGTRQVRVFDKIYPIEPMKQPAPTVPEAGTGHFQPPVPGRNSSFGGQN